MEKLPINDARDEYFESINIKIHVTQKINPYINKYVFSKFLSEQVVNFYSKDVPSIVVRLSNIYGYTKLRRPDLVPTIMQDIFEKEQVKIWSNKPERDFIFTEDAADAVLILGGLGFLGLGLPETIPEWGSDLNLALSAVR